MNIRDFINQREKCPLCDTTLITQFISFRKQKNKFIENRLVFVFVMKEMKLNQSDYEIGYSFNIDDNTFQIEFYNEWDQTNQVGVHMLNKFKEFHKNLGACRFYRRCTFCNRYCMTSTSFTLDFKRQIFNHQIPFGNDYEVFGLTTPVEGGFNIVILCNFEKSGLVKKSDVQWFRSDKEESARLDHSMPPRYSTIEVDYIPFVSKEETSKRLNKLLLFA
jgi:hypothetical protein